MDYVIANIVCNEFHQRILKYRSEQIPGTAYTFKYYKRDNYCCVSCFELGQIRSITVRNGHIVARKNPEDGHHPNCLQNFRWKQERLGWFTVIFLLNICAKLFMERTTSKSKSFLLTVDRGFKRVMVHLVEINGIILHFWGKFGNILEPKMFRPWYAPFGGLPSPTPSPKR